MCPETSTVHLEQWTVADGGMHTDKPDRNRIVVHRVEFDQENRVVSSKARRTFVLKNMAGRQGLT